MLPSTVSPASLSVILDMDGLMLDTETISRRIWREAARDLGVPADPSLFDELVGLNETSSHALLVDRLRSEVTVEALIDLVRARYRAYLADHGVPKKPGLEALLGFLAERGVRRTVATSTARALAIEKLRHAAVLEYFDAGMIVGGDEVRRGKPAPDIFLLAASRLESQPSACVVLEDSAPGIRAAAAAGMIPVLVPDGTPPADETRRTAYATVGSLGEARQLLQTFLDTAASA